MKCEYCGSTLDEYGFCPECDALEPSPSRFVPVDSVSAEAARIKREHPDWVVQDLGWGINAYDPTDPWEEHNQ